MNLIIISLFALVASGCSSAAESLRPDMEPGLARFATLPADARAVAERAALCGHFAGEISGDRSERDHEVYRRMEELGCGTIDRALSAVRTKYAGNHPVLEVLAPLGRW